MKNKPKRKGWIAWAIIGGIIVTFLVMYVANYNTLNAKLQTADEGASLYSAALNTCTQKIEGVWTTFDQYMKHENITLVGVTEARNSYYQAAKNFAQAKESGDNKTMTEAGSKTVQAALAFQFQLEAYPNLQAAGVAKENIRNMESSINEIKTALDDWIKSIKDYNLYRGSALPGIFSFITTNRFPDKIPYYEGEIKNLDIKDLNPQKK